MLYVVDMIMSSHYVNVIVTIHLILYKNNKKKSPNGY